MRCGRLKPSRVWAHMPPASNALLLTWQEASVFNQPLSLDTSSVTDMKYMFSVCSARALSPMPMRAFACTLLHALLPTAALSHLPASRLVCPFFTRQGASSFNQPLSLDTSKVTDMGIMFYVRFARASPPISSQTLACTFLAPPPLHAFPPPGLHAARLVRPPSASAECKLLVQRKQVAHQMRLVRQYLLHH